MSVRVLRSVGLVGLVGTAAIVASVGASPVGAATQVAAKSTTFAGYEVTPHTHITRASETFVVPTITCKRSFSGVGPAMLIDSTVDKKTNTFNVSGGGIGVACQNSKPVFVAIPIVDGTNYDTFNLAAGDKVRISVTYGAKTSATVDDLTGKQSITKTGKKSVGSTAFFGTTGLEVNNRSLGLDPFTKTVFSDASVNGHTLAKVKAQQYDWYKHGTLLVDASALTSGKNFTTTFKHSS